MSVEADTDVLLQQIGAGSERAWGELLSRFEARLRNAVAARMDRRLSARFSQSDVMQEAFAIAARRLPDYLVKRPIPFYPWLRQIALERLVELHRRHVGARVRSVLLEEEPQSGVSEDALHTLAHVLIDPRDGPFEQAVRREVRSRVQQALQQFPLADRELILMRFVERMSVIEIATLLGITAGAAKSRLRRALERLHAALNRSDSDS